ncbi:hypothetical protein GCM10010145_46700 [Streptomyces ruber]|uniref:Uncharacterized protein n=2 Tax=Streptomyces TaxID=1883 RepID=A0A918EVH7_9ACTN|nr:hypothetical protein [Streptomyces ruber]GGQ71564.1 hypothetical protein GCM10010145_46700 [Streptomyces ruber]
MRQNSANGRGMSGQLVRARRKARHRLRRADRTGTLRTVRGEVLPLAGELRAAAPEAFRRHRDSLAVLLDECPPAVADETPRPAVTGFDGLHVRRLDARDADALPAAGRPGERPVIHHLLHDALDLAADPVLREVSKANQRSIRILQRVNQWIRLLADIPEEETLPGMPTDPVHQ